MLKKQTTWVMTMLTLMIVLSAYYIVTNPLSSMSVEVPNKDITQIVHENVTIDNNKQNANNTATNTNLDTSSDNNQIVESNSDFFIGYKLERDTRRSQQVENYFSIMSDPNATSEAIANAKEQIDYLTTLEDSEVMLEEMIKAEGFEEVVVMAKENQADVIVQTQDLNNEQVVKIINLVSQQLQIPSNSVVVTYHK